MKNFILILLLISCGSLFSQKYGIVNYKISSINFKPEYNPNDPEASKESSDIIKIAEDQNFKLTFNTNQSKFEISDSEKLEVSRKEEFYTRLARISYTSDDFYINKKTFQCIQDNNDGTLLERKNYVLDWKITTESKLIDGYLCYKAVYEQIAYNAKNDSIVQQTVAWFSPSLPYSYGPKKYYGLPGLILELNEARATFLATKITLQEGEIPIELPKGKLINYDVYSKIILSRKYR
jgi:GLPGLI family protein